MDPVTWTALLVPSAAVVFAAIGRAYFLRRASASAMRVERWRAVAERLELADVALQIRPLEPVLAGWAGRHRVRFEVHRDAAERSAVVTRVKVEGYSGITLRPESFAMPLAERLPMREIELGDPGFDAEVSVRGDPGCVRAILDAETRGIVRRMMRGRVELPGRAPVDIASAIVLERGNLLADFPERAEPVEELAKGVAALLPLAERFRRPRDIAERLAASIRTEPLLQVRLRGLEVLCVEYPLHRPTMAALRHALADEVAEVRLRAAIALGVEGRQTLLEIAVSGGGPSESSTTAGDSGIDDAVGARAIDVLGEHLSAEACEPILRRALRLGRLQTAEACIQALGRGGGSAAVTLLGEVLSREGIAEVLSRETGPLAVAAARALGAIRAPEAEAPLLAALARDRPELSLPVVEALGHVGSARAVPAIREAAEAPGAGGELRRAARQAVAEIQSRLPGASPGQVSIADAEAGQLSLADADPHGRVSLPEGQPTSQPAPPRGVAS